jgi:thioredoxin
MKNLFLVFVFGVFMFQSTACTANGKAEKNSKSKTVEVAPDATGTIQVISLDEASFILKVFDFKNSKEWAYKGDRPAIIDFYAEWCGPCKRLAPVLVELQQEYGDKIQVYKVDAEKNRELAASFGVDAYPTLLFIPMNDKPAGAKGLLPKEELERIIGTFLKVTK